MFNYCRYKSLSNIQLATPTTTTSESNSPTTSHQPPRPLTSKTSPHHIHNTYSFKSFHVHDTNYELQKSSSTGTTNLKTGNLCDTLNSSSKSSSNIKAPERARSRSVNLGIFDGIWHRNKKSQKKKLYVHHQANFDRTLYL